MNTIIPGKSLSQEEHLKEKSNYLRGTILDSLADPLTGSVSPDDAKLLKFHGSYMQHDRDLEKERKRQKLEPLYQFMTRVRVPGGITTPAQWLVLDKLADEFGNGTLKLTTRQSFQFHGILKRNLKKTVQAVNEALMTTIATCGDVNRNVMCNPNPFQSAVHWKVYDLAKEASDYFQPKTNAYFEIWLDDQRVEGTQDVEPLYHSTYLPRKFKIAFAIPPNNDIDIFANDLGFIAIEENGKLLGFNVCVGGGMGSTFGDPSTYPRLADVIGFITTDQVISVAETVIAIQRDFGNRLNRKNARLKYTIDSGGLDWFVDELNKRLEAPLLPPLSFHFETNGDVYGWTKGFNQKWFYTLYIENGRVKDKRDYTLKTAIRQIATRVDCDLRLTGNQNLIIGNVSPSEKSLVEEILSAHHVLNNPANSAMRLHSMACVALGTCGLAFAESERYLPSLIDKLDAILNETGLEKEAINIRMTGCPNGCARSALGEIGLIGRAVGHYNLYLGASHNGDRLNVLYKEMLSEDEIIQTLEPILLAYGAEKLSGEHFGDFVHRKNIVS